MQPPAVRFVISVRDVRFWNAEPCKAPPQPVNWSKRGRGTMKSRRETIGWWIALGMLPIAAFAVVSVWVYGYSYRYRRFCDDFAASVASAQGSGRMTAVCDGVTTRVTRDNADYIYRKITGAAHHGYAMQPPEGACVELDFGNGDTMTIWPSEGGTDEGLTVPADEADAAANVIKVQYAL